MPCPEITRAQVEQFREEGYFILPSAIGREDLELLRQECAQGIAEQDRELDREGVDVSGIVHRGKRYFIRQPSLKSPALLSLFLSRQFAAIARATVGDTAFAFYEQFVVKGADNGLSFGWHQDGGYIASFMHKPYITCWCAMDDVSEDNGTAYILPVSRAGTRDIIKHTRQEGTNDMVGYFGKDPGIPVVGPAGTIAVFASYVFHRSGANRTSQVRRAYVAQYSPEVILRQPGMPLHRSEALLRDGNYVAQLENCVASS